MGVDHRATLTSASYDSACQYGLLSSARMTHFVHVYILQSETDPERFYTGSTRNLRERLRHHNSGDVRHTAKWKPWRLKTYVALEDETRAREFERYRNLLRAAPLQRSGSEPN